MSEPTHASNAPITLDPDIIIARLIDGLSPYLGTQHHQPPFGQCTNWMLVPAHEVAQPPPPSPAPAIEAYEFIARQGRRCNRRTLSRSECSGGPDER